MSNTKDQGLALPAVNGCGVYLLFKKKRLVYVGRSQDTTKRVRGHRNNGRQFDHAVHLSCAPIDAVWIEKALIEALNPPQNQAGVVRPREEEPDETAGEAVRVVEEPRHRDPRETMPIHRAVGEAQKLGFRQLCMDAIKTGELRSTPANPARTEPGGKRYITRGDLAAWLDRKHAERSAA